MAQSDPNSVADACNWTKWHEIAPRYIYIKCVEAIRGAASTTQDYPYNRINIRLPSPMIKPAVKELICQSVRSSQT